jgi:16S rRNA G527 N7-methylase RsmG
MARFTQGLLKTAMV